MEKINNVSHWYFNLSLSLWNNWRLTYSCTKWCRATSCSLYPVSCNANNLQNYVVSQPEQRHWYREDTEPSHHHTTPICRPFIISFFKSSPEDMLIDFRERGGEKEREEHRSVASCTHPDWGSDPQQACAQTRDQTCNLLVYVGSRSRTHLETF